MLLAADAEDISEAVRFVREHNIDLAVRGGGHSCAGTSSSDGGLVIDLSRMRKVTVDTTKKTITAEGGALWADVDEAGAEYDLATVGGTVNHTGIGGLTLGGGYGWLTAKYGLVIDNLVSAVVVLADGRIVTASADSEPELFWAIRGAGHNFGVAVSFTYQAYDQPNKVFAGPLVFTPDKLEDVVDVLNSTLSDPDQNSGLICAVSRPPNAPVPMVIAIIFYNGTQDEAKKRFKALYDLEPVMDEAKPIPYSTVNSLMNGNASHGGRRNLKGVFYSPPLRPAFARTIMNVFTEKILSEPDLAGTALLFECFDMTKACEIPTDETAFANRGRTQNGVLTMRWNNPANDRAHRQWARDLQTLFQTEMDEVVKGNSNSAEVPQYINYAERRFHFLLFTFFCWLSLYAPRHFPC